ncbi:hypothetical protein EVAR_23851_1 [Eumeta japonica]|uniref:Uncharacterized protein n=1 Tax=Eumeta variegata TaxID=151549 RepID=A0A4C1V3R7_EUMVA|nr:hypothetical protein EVAR_23851_1 [Eumeta japonica]
MTDMRASSTTHPRRSPFGDLLTTESEPRRYGGGGRPALIAAARRGKGAAAHRLARCRGPVRVTGAALRLMNEWPAESTAV